MQRQVTYLGALVGVWLTFGCNEKPTDDPTAATPDPSALTKLLASASALPATSGGSAPASSAPKEAPPAKEVSFEELRKLTAGPAIVKFTGTVVEHSKCDCEGKDCKPCLKYIVVSERSEGPYQKAADFAVLTPGDPQQYPLGKQFEFSVTITPSKEVGGTLADLRLVYARQL